ncbi:carbohydrate ABC transporter permease [Pseudonocardia sp. HH130630-07]|uniref:carbohydrate ABC transporter permease n=1 Tax=Pseudonocardia sp. HH130630-07 TaxID=1690815 RepID=UPI000814FEF7|nr:sugar ABC transporter permease [Pseudonocardia sp. HH130630-07]ANY05503.1 sugar ABC transporter permease [Pseudonocardia sp. HH130630-07]
MTRTSAAPVAADRGARGAGPAPRRRPVTGLWFSAPYVAAFALFLAWPILYLFYLSFTGTSLTGKNSGFVGFDNYTEALTDPEMWASLANTVFFTVITVIPLVAVALLLAVLVSAGLPGQWVWRLAFFGPFLLASSVVTTLWGWIYQSEAGLANTVLGLAGIDAVGWTSEESVAMRSIAILTVWWTVGFNFLLYVAALQAIPEQLYEAAALDGAGPLRRTWAITLPMLRPTTSLVVLLQLLASMKVFDQIYLLVKGGPNGSTRPILEYVYDVGFAGYRIGYGAAISFIFFVVVVAVSAVWALRSRKGPSS